MNKSIADQLIELGLTSEKPSPKKPSPLKCPECGSPYINRYTIFGTTEYECDDCEFCGDKESFM